MKNFILALALAVSSCATVSPSGVKKYCVTEDELNLERRLVDLSIPIYHLEGEKKEVRFEKLGSGVLIDERYLVTAAHLLRRVNASDIQVQSLDARTYEVINGISDAKNDLAFLELKVDAQGESLMTLRVTDAREYLPVFYSRRKRYSDEESKLKNAKISLQNNNHSLEVEMDKIFMNRSYLTFYGDIVSPERELVSKGTIDSSLFIEPSDVGAPVFAQSGECFSLVGVVSRINGLAGTGEQRVGSARIVSTLPLTKIADTYLGVFGYIQQD